MNKIIVGVILIVLSVYALFTSVHVVPLWLTALLMTVSLAIFGLAVRYLIQGVTAIVEEIIKKIEDKEKANENQSVQRPR